MANTPHKVVRVIVWSSASPEYRDDALVALDEGFESTERKFGRRYAHAWAYRQAAKSIPYGLLTLIARIGWLFWRIGS